MQHQIVRNAEGGYQENEKGQEYGNLVDLPVMQEDNDGEKDVENGYM
jgi:hypothetical protein